MELLDQEVRQELAKSGLLRSMRADASLSYHLHRLTKAELTEIRRQLAVKGVSSLPKQELAEVLHGAIIDSLPSQLQLLDEITFDDLRALVKKKGLLKNPTDIPPETLLMLRKMGLGFTGVLENHGLILIMPRELVAPCQELLKSEELRQTIFTNQKVLLVCRGLLAYYGIMPLADMRDRLQEMGLPTSEPHFSRLVTTIGVGNGYFDHVGDFLCDKRVVFYEEVLRHHIAKQEYGYLPVSLEEALLAAQQMYIDWTDYHRELFAYLQAVHGLDDEEAAEELMFLIFAINNHVPIPSLLQRLWERGIKLPSFTNAIEFLTLLEKTHKHTRLWQNLGYTPAEMEELQSRPRLRVITREN